MSATEENQQRVEDLSGAGRNGEVSPSEDAATSRRGTGGGEMPDRSDTGVTLGAGEPNTFEPEEAAPAPEAPKE